MDTLELVSPPNAPVSSTSAPDFSHDGLTRMGARWLRRQGMVAYREVSSVYGMERCDVIGWRNGGSSVLLECKTSRADFKRDGEKCFRNHKLPGADKSGYGNFRYYLCPAGLLQPEDMPPKWGLLWAYPTRVVTKKAAETFDYGAIAVNEKRLLCALLHRLEAENRDYCERLGICLPTRSQ